MRAAAALLAAAALAACDSGPGAGQAAADSWFVESAAELGIDFEHVSAFEQRFDFPEIMGGGAALFDRDGDGDLDLYLVQSGDLRAPEGERPPNRLFENRGGGAGFVDVTEASGAGDRGYGMGCAVGDYDADGDLDLYVLNVGPNVLLRNDDGRFTDVTAQAGVGHAGWGSSAAFLDYDGDGALDLFVVNYLRWSTKTERECRFPKEFRDYCNPNSYDAPAQDVLYRGLGDGRFEDATEAAGLAGTLANGLGVACGDFDGDGTLDVYVANDMNANQLWLNRGDGSFRDGALLSGCALSGTGFAESGMGVQSVDLDGDGRLDLFLSHLRRQSNTLYRNGGAGLFDDVTARAGLSASSLPFTGFGLGAHDFDRDGQLDLFVANGEVTVPETGIGEGDPYVQANLLYRGLGGTTFEEVSPRGGTAPELLATSRGAAFGDLDADGDVDVVVVNRDLAVHVLVNRAGAGREWVAFDVRDRRGSTALGARVRVRAGEAFTAWRLVDPAYSYGSASDVRAHFGLGAHTEVEVLVRWRDGSEQDFGRLAAGRVHELRQAKAR
jgi:hypothetical protein